MRITILQLSDIHIRSPRDKILLRANQIGGTVNPISHPSEAILLAITGDATQAGKAEEFGVATTFFAAIIEAIKSHNPGIPVHVLSVPGNHDCDFSPPQGTRDIVLDAIANEAAKANDRDIRATCMGPQNAYFTYHASIAATGTYLIDQMCHRHWITVDNTRICIDHFNTAWVSRLHERPGTLTWPTAESIEPEESDLSLALLHHPLGWHHPETQRLLRQTLNATADIVLTGHEHIPEHHKSVFSSGVDTTHIFGGVLQDHDFPGDCSFNVVNVDVDSTSRSYRVFEYHWKSKAFRPVDRDPPAQTFRDRASLRDRDFRLTEKFRNFLSDPGASFSHPRKDTITIDDLYVFPTLREHKGLEHAQKKKKTVDASKIPEILLSQPRLMLVGAELSGKTALAKMAFHALRERDYIPIFIRGRSFIGFPSEVNTGSVVSDAIRNQYGIDQVDAILSSPPAARVAIVDDLHLARLSGRSLDILRHELEIMFGSVVLFGDPTIRIDELSPNRKIRDEFVRYGHFDIQLFGYELREKLIRRWELLGRGDMQGCVGGVCPGA